MMQGIYKIQNKVNGKYYLGSSSDVGRRWGAHKNALRKGCSSPHLQNAWNKYGEANFVCEPVEEVIGTKAMRFAREQVYLDDGFSSGILYNISVKAGGGNQGDEVNQKISITQKRYFETHENPMKGRHHKLESCLLISSRMIEYYRTHENPMGGRTHSQKAREAISQANRGRKHTAEELQKMSETHLGNTNASKSYPAFYNERTGEYIPAGLNLKEQCQRRSLDYGHLVYIKGRQGASSRSGWRLAKPEDIGICQSML